MRAQVKSDIQQRLVKSIIRIEGQEYVELDLQHSFTALPCEVRLHACISPPINLIYHFCLENKLLMMTTIPQAPDIIPPAITTVPKEQEIARLENLAKWLEQTLEQIRKRLEELKSSEKE